MHPTPILGLREAAAGPIAVAEAALHLRGAAGLAEVRDGWERLDRSVALPMAHGAWTKSFIEARGLADRLHVFAAARGGSVAAIAALVRQDGPFAALALPGADELGEPVDFPALDRSALAALCGALARSSLPLELPRVPAESPTLDALREAYEGRGVVLVRPGRPYPFVPLDPSWAEPEAHLSARRRGDLRRARRSAAQRGALSFSIAAPSPEKVGALLDEAFRVEAAGWKGRARTALACDAALGSFFRTYALEAARQGFLRVGLLHIGERPAAMQIAVQHGGRYWLLKIGYDEAFAAASPGLLLLCESLRRAALAGLSSYEFLGGVAPWIKPWTERERACVAVSAFPASFSGLSALTSRALAHAARRVKGVFSWNESGGSKD